MNIKYICYFISYSGEVCLRNCRRSEGCCFHYKALDYVLCSECRKKTRSDSGQCTDHIRGYYVSKHFQKHLKKGRG